MKGICAGQPNESGCIQAMQAGYDFMTTVLLIPPERIIFFGRSIGSGD
jgi:hypothetical protein